MELCLIFLSCFTCLIVNGVCGDDVKSVSVTEGDSVTLHTDVIKQKDDLILWCYGSKSTVVARINGEAGSIMLTSEEIFRDRLKLSEETADLTIADVTTQHAGPYTLRISSNNKVTYKNFNVTVHAHLPVPASYANNPVTEKPKHQDITLPWSPKEKANVIPAVVVSVISSISIISFIIGISISFFIHRRAKANKRKSSEGENLTKSDEKRSIDFSGTSKDQEASRFLNEKQHWNGAGSV